MFLYHPNKEPFPEVTGMSLLEIKRCEMLMYLYDFEDILSDPYRISGLCSFAISLTFHLFSLT